MRFIIFFLLTFTLNVSAEIGPWVLKKNKNGIKVYNRTLGSTNITEFRVVSKIKASRNFLAEILIDVGNYKNWYPGVLDSYILKKISPKEYLIYYSIDAPWPVSNRDMVMRMTISKKKEETLIKFITIRGIKSKMKGFVRMTKGRGFWKLTSKDNYTSVLFQFLSNPEGKLPKWILRLFVVEGPYNTMKGLRNKVEED